MGFALDRRKESQQVAETRDLVMMARTFNHFLFPPLRSLLFSFDFSPKGLRSVIIQRIRGIADCRYREKPSCCTSDAVLYLVF